MPVTRLGVGYLYANMRYGGSSILHRRLVLGWATLPVLKREGIDLSRDV